LTLLSADVNRSWDLPFDFQTNGVRATIDAQSNLTIQITKATESAEDAVSYFYNTQTDIIQFLITSKLIRA